MYRSHLYESPVIIAYSQSIIKRVVQSSEEFILEWPTREVLRPQSLTSLHGDHHARIKSFIANALNRPQALRTIVHLVQPHIAAALQSWAQKGKVKTFYEMKKVAFVYIGKYIASFEVGPELDTLEQLILGLSKGHRAHPRKIPGTTYYHALQDENMKMTMEKHGEYISREDISKLKYTNKVVDETLRMAGISTFVFRTATDDINLD
ncbi:hypothetical protein Ancab_022814, partial [Ancistrocladus abbreviatus]